MKAIFAVQILVNEHGWAPGIKRVKTKRKAVEIADKINTIGRDNTENPGTFFQIARVVRTTDGANWEEA